MISSVSRQYQGTDSDTENYRLVWPQIHYDITGKNNNVSFVSLDILSLIMSVSPSNCHYSKYISGSSWLWSYGSWIYNYLCNQFQSPLKLWVQIPLMARCTQYNIMWLSLSVTCGRSVVFSRYSHFLHQSNWLPWYNWNIVESGIKHHNNIVIKCKNQRENQLETFPKILIISIIIYIISVCLWYIREIESWYLIFPF